ncbi:TrbA [Pseudomonas savastanoi pv. glycinea]|uniref:TrbA n=1 Tax=Pseudomonas savastanoi pv. glycinea TaxID=318 RepID=A0ABR5LGS9_PSESG|nr:TrbA [Pseudomonas savastanoi pv. glycinea]KPC46675.1 TrbA [Pseudomonas savastanoi pv. glycinea]
MEGAGVQAQARAEVHASKLGLPRPGLMVTQAIDGLQAELESIGLVFARHIITPKRREASDLPVMTAVYAVQPTELTEPA